MVDFSVRHNPVAVRTQWPWPPSSYTHSVRTILSPSPSVCAYILNEWSLALYVRRQASLLGGVQRWKMLASTEERNPSRKHLSIWKCAPYHSHWNEIQHKRNPFPYCLFHKPLHYGWFQTDDTMYTGTIRVDKLEEYFCIPLYVLFMKIFTQTRLQWSNVMFDKARFGFAGYRKLFDIIAAQQCFHLAITKFSPIRLD